MTKLDTLRKLIKELVDEELDETSTSAATPGFLIPGAFRGNSAAGKAKQRKNSMQAGYEMIGTQEPADNMDGDDPWEPKPMGEAIRLTKLPIARKYINSINDKDTKDYAEAYLKWLATDQSTDPPQSALGAMAKQAVKIQLDNIFGEK